MVVNGHKLRALGEVLACVIQVLFALNADMMCRLEQLCCHRGAERFWVKANKWQKEAGLRLDGVAEPPSQ